MADPITLAALGAVALSEGIKFLYGQASELLRARKERRLEAELGGKLPTAVQMSVPDSTPLDNGAVHFTADAQTLEEHHAKLAELAARLAPYAQDWTDIDPADVSILTATDQLRMLLEAVYGQRLTFQGEQREESGTRVDVRQLLGNIDGAVAGVRAKNISGEAQVSVSQTAEGVGVDGKLTGIEADRIG
ncbi:MAG: hypothetical protein ACRDSP_20875 [Pseudonocardiaceae bacterium]